MKITIYIDLLITILKNKYFLRRRRKKKKTCSCLACSFSIKHVYKMFIILSFTWFMFFEFNPMMISKHYIFLPEM